MTAVVLVGGIVAYDHRESLGGLFSAPTQIAAARQDTSSKPRLAAPTKMPSVTAVSLKATPAMPIPDRRPLQTPVEQGPETASLAPLGDVEKLTFFYCTTDHDRCVVDGRTFWFNDRKITMADIDAPDILHPKCEGERKLGSAAKKRLWQLLNAGSFTLAPANEGDDDAKRLVLRGGKSLGQQLISEGLARPRAGKSPSWCGEHAT